MNRFGHLTVNLDLQGAGRPFLESLLVNP